jgi:putative membrane protein
MQCKLMAALGTLLLLGGVSGGAATHAAGMNSRPTAADKRFMRTMAQGGIAEVKLGKLALQKTRSTRVHNVAVTIVQDHTQANAALMQIARREGVMLPMSMDAKHKMMYARLSHMSGTAFNHAYINGQVKDHVKALAMLSHEQMMTHNRPLLTFLRETTPKIKMHARELRQIQMAQRRGHGGPVQRAVMHTSGLLHAHH